MYGGCPIVWASKLQREVALSTTEAEYNALSESLRWVIHLMALLKETTTIGWAITKQPPKIHCKVFEDNSGALEMARLPKMRPRTKHLCVKLHHFRRYVRDGSITIHKVPTDYQLADMETKPQAEPLYVRQREAVMQWLAEFMSREELMVPAYHLRACEIIDMLPQLIEHASQNHKKGQPD